MDAPCQLLAMMRWFAQQVRQLVDVEEHGGDVPRRLHRCRQPLAGTRGLVREGLEFALQMLDLAGFAPALHEQHTVELDSGASVQVGRALVRTEGRRRLR